MRWLTLLVSLPPTPTRHRVGVWRKLKRMGAVKLKGAAWILPETPETIELFQWLVQEIQSSRGEATLMRVDRIDTMTDEQLTALFHRERAAEYQSLMQACREVRAQLDRSTTAHRVSVEPARARLERLKRELDRIQSIDYLESPLGRRARVRWETVSKRLQTMAARPRAATRQPHHALPPSGSTWVTRHDRTSTALRPRGSSNASSTRTRDSLSRTRPTLPRRGSPSTSSAPSSGTTARTARSKRS